jgi:hypothetical protein
MLAVILIVVALLAAWAPSAGAATRGFVPPEGRSFLGVSDTGDPQHFNEFSEQVGTHPAVLQTFHVWGTHPWQALERWQATQTRGMLSISTTDSYSGEERISPRQIANGRGDEYPLLLNRRFGKENRTVYIRLLPEMNGHWNPYAAFNSDGSSRGGDHSTAWFRQAWRRFAVILRGGPRAGVNRRLKRLGLPRLMRAKSARDYRKLDVPAELESPRVALMWVPQTHGSPNIAANLPRAYWPGARYVDWVGADIYAKYPNFAGLNRFYRDFRRKPFVIGEFSPWDYDSPAFIKRLFNWALLHRRTRLLVYFQAFGDTNPHHIDRYPEAHKALRKRVGNGKRFARFAPGTRHDPSQDGGGDGGGGGGDDGGGTHVPPVGPDPSGDTGGTSPARSRSAAKPSG